ncbi:MAG: sensor histidine kinase [Giesbergeria sp.]|nr:sensor histidine kinase [Giesbergeria sp.]
MPETVPAIFVNADRAKMHQALLNILSNAYKYSPQGGDVVVRYCTQGGADQPSRVGVEVQDHGIGLTAEQVPRVCERFYRADTSGQIPGTGLGMSIVKEIIELHGGDVEVHSQPGTGTTIRLWLPAA